MKIRFRRAIGAVILCSSLLTGCLFDSRKPHGDPLRYETLGDGKGISWEMDFAPTSLDSGLFLTWTNTAPNSIFAHRIELTHLDSSGFFVSSEESAYGDSINITSPRISINRIQGRAKVWIETFWDGIETEVAVQIVSSSHASPEPLHPDISGLLTARHVTVLALPDNGFLLGVEGRDSSGIEELRVQRFDLSAKPVGAPWLQFGLPATSAPELVLMPDGGWTAIWTQSGPDASRIAWQRFDAGGDLAGATRIRLLPAGSSDITTLRADPLPAGRILVQARSGIFIPFIIGADDDAENGWPDAGDWEGASLAADTLRHRFYGLREGKLLRMDSAFQVQATREMPTLLEWPPALAVMPAGKIALIGHGHPGRPTAERRALLVYTLDPF